MHPYPGREGSKAEANFNKERIRAGKVQKQKQILIKTEFAVNSYTPLIGIRTRKNKNQKVN